MKLSKKLLIVFCIIGVMDTSCDPPEEDVQLHNTEIVPTAKDSDPVSKPSSEEGGENSGEEEETSN